MNSAKQFKRSSAVTLLVTGKRILKSVTSTVTALAVVVVASLRDGDFGGGDALLMLGALGAAIAADVVMALKSISADAEKLIDEKVSQLQSEASLEN